MVSPTPTTSKRLVRAVSAERAELARHRERLLAAKAGLREELDRIEGSLAEVEDRDALLARLAGPQTGPAGPQTGPAGPHTGPDGPHTGPDGPQTGPDGTQTGPDGTQTGPESSAPEAAVAEPRPAGVPAERLLRGPAIRRAAVQVLLDQPGRPEALHYRAWYERLVAAGYAVDGKDPLAVFLTQISRSPVITRGTTTGVYSLDPQAPRRLRQRLDELHAELRSLSSTPDTIADLAATRARRTELTSDIARTERALEEAESLLAPAHHSQRATCSAGRRT